MGKRDFFIVAVIFFLIGFNLSLLAFKIEVVRPELPRDNKSTNFEDYTNQEVRDGINFARYYLNNPEKLLRDNTTIYNQWLDYKSRVCNNFPEHIVMEYFNYWIMCYPFGI